MSTTSYGTQLSVGCATRPMTFRVREPGKPVAASLPELQNRGAAGGLIQRREG